uniref:non-specific serine/threonine protein kinase n=1 Tax=Leersia perrieri TaxID=77586 RepID=A0A0D9UWF0_9ORYZ
MATRLSGAIDPHQAAALLRLKESFYLAKSPVILPSWRDGTDCCTWGGVGCDASSRLVTILDLGGYGLHSDGFDPALFSLTSLRHLDLSMNSLGTTKDAKFGWLTLLTHLNLSNSGLDGQIPMGINKLANLVSLDLSNRSILHNSDNGILFYETDDEIIFTPDYEMHLHESSLLALVANLSNLRELYLDWVDMSRNVDDWCKAIPQSVPRLQMLKEFGLEGKLIYMYFLTSIGPIGSLCHLELFNMELLGDAGLNLLSWIGDLENLTSLVLFEFDFSGVIPSSITYLKNLRSLTMYDCNLPRPILSAIGNLVDLQSLAMSNCKTYGSMPPSIGNLTNLKSLYINNPGLSGPMPAAIGNLKSLKSMGFSICNFAGPIPSAIGNLTMLQTLEISFCQFSGPIPYSIAQLKELRVLIIDWCDISGRIPNSVVNITRLIYLRLSANCLSGKIPTDLFTLPALRILSLRDNQISGPIEEFDAVSSALVGLSLNGNELTGEFPKSLFLLNSLLDLRIDSNNLSLWKLLFLGLSYNNLSVIDGGDLRENHFEGILPFNITSGCALQTIDFNGNRFKGQLPKALLNCSSLNVLDIGNNLIVDTFPFWLRGLSVLQVLILRSNQFYGSLGVPKEEKSGKKFPSLQIIDIASNNFSGNFHLQWFDMFEPMQRYNNTGQLIEHENLSTGSYQDTITISYKGFSVTFQRILTTLTAIDLSENSLEGSIPESIGELVSLHALNLSHNAFSGEIPPQLGGMTALESLDLSSNQISGEIPQELTNLTFLSILNLSYNELEGKIPQSRQFATFGNSSYKGNGRLCGKPLPECGSLSAPVAEPRAESSSEHVDIVMFLFVGVGFGVGFAIGILMKKSWISRWFHSEVSR